MQIWPSLFCHHGSSASQALAHPLGLRPGRQDRGRRRRAAREDVCQATNVLKKASWLLLPPFLLKFLCRTVTKEDGSVRESTTPVLSRRFLVLLDYLLHKSPYWSTGNYEKRVHQQIRSFFVERCEESHRKNVHDLAGVTLLLILPFLAQ